jgi:hypothetical protein
VRTALGLGLGAALALAGCALLQKAPQPPTTEGEWATARDGATRRALLYDRFNHRASATATLLTREVREARARRLAEWFGWTQAELVARLAQERKEADAGEEFFLAFYTSDSHDNDLDAPKSIWRVAVKLEGADVVAKRVTSTDKDSNLLVLFPYVGQFDVAYRVLLPPAPGGPLAGRDFVLEVTSGVGRLSLDFGAPSGPPLGPQAPAPPP